ncbi:hypothetical protein MMPV_001208 [Pyropia vietnamensis]
MLLAASAAAGVLSRCVVHPLDTIRAQMMVARPAVGAAAATGAGGTRRGGGGGGGSGGVSGGGGGGRVAGCPPHGPPPPPRGLLATARAIATADGIRGFYRGLSVSAAMQAPAVATYLSTYDSAKAALSTRVATRWPAAAGGSAAEVAAHPVTHLAAGLTAEAVSAVFWVPMEVLKQRAQVRRGSPADASVGGILRDLLRTEGVRGLFRGYALTVGVFGPYSMIYFMAYERGKRGWATALKGRDGTQGAPLPLYAVVSAAAASGAVAAAATSPLDVVKTRIQTQGDVGGGGGAGARAGATAVGANTPAAATAAAATATAPPSTAAYASTAHAVRRIVAEEGVRGLCRGLTARVLWIMPGTAITMGTFEAIKQRM